MQRCGDLLQRESLITNATQRRQVNEMAVVIGTAMEHIAKATSASAHIYKNLELGPQTGQVKLACNSFDPMFAEIVRATGTVSTVGQEESKAAAAS